MKTALKCNCGQRIFSRDVMQQGYYVRQFGASYVYIRFRCSRCKRLGEHFIKQEDWEDTMLKSDASELVPTEKRKFEELGKISVDEMIDFHYELDKLNSLPVQIDEE